MIQTLFGSTEEKPSFLKRMKEAVTRTRESLSERIEEVVAFRKEIDRDTLDELEATLHRRRPGHRYHARQCWKPCAKKWTASRLAIVEELKRVLKDELLAILNAPSRSQCQRSMASPRSSWSSASTASGKTTSIGKLAHLLRAQGKTVLLAAADTFRAAAIEQLEIWGDRTGAEVIKNKPGGDPSAVLFDALQAAKARGTDYVIVDTAGRLHTKTSLMAELEKMRRTAQRFSRQRAA